VTGLCAYNDDGALAVLAGLRREGLVAPPDHAVVGVDDIPAAALAGPPLTTVRSGQDAAAQHLFDTVLAQLRVGPAPPGPGSDTIELVVRESG
jgi:DNA-binding LacI/PurR family transcriptional regulator